MGCSSSTPGPSSQQASARVPPQAQLAGIAGPWACCRVQASGQHCLEEDCIVITASVACASKLAGIAPSSGSDAGKGKSKGRRVYKGSKFQVELCGKWENYGVEEDGILKRAFLVGQKNAKFQLRGQSYEYNFEKRVQKNENTGKERKIRPPQGMFAPSKPLLPPGLMIVVQVPEGGGKSMQVADPNNSGRQIIVAIPPKAKLGARMAVPCPEKGEEMQKVVQRQRAWRKGDQDWSIGAKMAAGMSGVGALAVGGIVLGEHLSGGAVSSWAEETPEIAAAADAITWTEGAVVDTTDWARGAWHWFEGATDAMNDWARDAEDWAEGAWDDAGDWAEVAAGDVAEWLGGAGEDVGRFVTSVY